MYSLIRKIAFANRGSCTQSQKAQFRIDTIPSCTILNIHHPTWTQSRIDTIPNKHNPEWTRFPNGHDFQWTRFQMDTIPNVHLHLYSYLDILYALLGKNCFTKTMIKIKINFLSAFNNAKILCCN